ncbi:MAG: carbohydrate kinase family protein [Spirochaetes bacterium]|nr:carbohydrate kinase family protein [Spirochaetota bacterium]MBU0955827.1 carbohydrate kinase family protein [Spirochaetota bacterium]
MNSIACAGNALLDISAFVNKNDIIVLGYDPGSTNHLPYDEVHKLLAGLTGQLRIAGGGAANTARVFKSLGGSSSFAGAVGNDDEGTLYANDLAEAGVASFIQKQEGHSGIFCALIDESGQRTIVVCPGVASSLLPAKIPTSFYASAPVLHVDGFLAEAPENLTEIMQIAAKAGQQISFDVGGRRVTMANRDLFRSLIKDFCTWVFMNEDELQAFTGHDLDHSLPALAKDLEVTLVIKRAQNGALCVHDGSLLESPVRAIRPLDATGAGDAFAAGFLTAVAREAPMAKALRFGNRVAEHAIQVPGMRINPDLLSGLPAWFL